MSTMSRHSLAPLSSSSLNSRASMGPSRVSMSAAAKRRTTISASANQGGRKSSVGGTGRQSLSRRPSGVGRNGIRQDPRPLSEKPYQHDSIRMVIHYLTEHGYDRAISPKLLSAPTTKEFLHILGFLYRQIDPTFEFSAKPEDDVLSMFKRLKYPFTISKSAMHSVGSLHTWPTLLASLRWLVELLTYGEEVAEKDPESIGSGDNNQNVFFDYVSKAYANFLAGDDEDEYAEELLKTFEAKGEELASDVETLREKEAELSQELQSLKSQPSPLEAITKKKEDFQSDIGKFKKLIANLETHQSVQETRLSEKKEEVAAKEKELADLSQSKNQLQERLKIQEANAVDLQKMTSERSMLEESLKNVNATKSSKEQAVWNLEIQINKKLEELRQDIGSYNGKAESLQLIPVMAKNAGGVDYELRLTNKNSTLADDMLSIDVKSVLKPALRQLKEATITKTRKTLEQVVDLSDKKSRCDDAKSEVLDEIQNLENKNRKLENALKVEKELVAEEMRLKASETDGLEEEIAKIRQDAQSTLLKSKAALDKAQLELEDLKRQHDREKEAMNDGLLAILDVLTAHKGYVQNQLAQVEKNVRDIVTDMKQTQIL